METNRDNLETIDLGSVARALANPDPRIRGAALDELRSVNKHHIQAKGILGILIDSLHRERDPQILSRLTKLIGQLGNSAVIPLVREFLWHDDLRVVANTLEGLAHIYSLDIIPIVQPFLNSEDNRIKANAARVLYNMNAALALEKLREMVRSDELFFRDSGVFILGSIGDARCLEELVDVLLGENDSEILKKAIHALTRKGDENTLKALRQINLTSIEQFRARYVEQIIGGISSRLGRQDRSLTAQENVDLDELHRWLQEGGEAEKVRACQLLVETGTGASLPLLRDACNDPATSVRYNAKKAINAIQRRGGTTAGELAFPARGPVTESRSETMESKVAASGDAGERMEEIDMVFLVLDLNNESPTVRAEAVSKLMFADRNTRGAQEAIGYLQDRLAVEDDPLVKSQIVRVMGKLGDRDVVPFLRGILEDGHSDFRVKANALEGLGYISDPEIFQVIVPYLSDTDNRIKANAIIAAWNHDKESTFRIISEMLDDSDVNMRDSAAYCLVVLKPRDRQAIERIRAAFIREMEPDVIAKLADCLAILGDEAMLEEFRQMVDHASELKRPYLQEIVERIRRKLDGAGTIPPPAESTEEVEEEGDNEGGESPEREPRYCEAAPELPPRIHRADGGELSLRAPEAHLLEFNHPDETIRLNSLEALAWYLHHGLPERLFGQVEMLLSLALNDQSLRVRKRAFDAFQLIRQKDYALYREEGA